jgi:hypothetical protein
MYWKSSTFSTFFLPSETPPASDGCGGGAVGLGLGCQANHHHHRHPVQNARSLHMQRKAQLPPFLVLAVWLLLDDTSLIRLQTYTIQNQ